jgi:hypothetical protein
MRAHYILGRTYADMGEAPAAVNAYLDAADAADTIAADCDYYTLTALYGQMAHLYHAHYLPEDEFKALLQSEHFAWKDHDTLAAIKAYELRERPYFFQKDTDAILTIEKKARELYLMAGKKEYAGRALRVSISLYLDRGQYDETRDAMAIYENESGWFDNNGHIKRGKELYYYDKGRYCLGTGKADSASAYFRRAFEAGYKEAGCKGLLSYFQYVNKPDSIAKYAQLFAAANDSCYYFVNQERVHQISAMYDYTRQKQIADKEAQNAQKARRVRNTLAIIIIITVVFVFFLIYRIKDRARKKYLRLTNAYEKSRLELTAAIDRQQLLTYDYSSAMEEKETEKQLLLQQIREVQDSNQLINQDKEELLQKLTALQNEQETITRLHDEDSRQKEIEIGSLRAKITKQETLLQQYRSIDNEAAFKSSPIYKLFNERKEARCLGNPPTEENWQQLIELFRTHFVRYYAFITYEHRLPINQYRYCILYRLGFDSTEIGILMDKDKDQRYNLRKFIYEALFGKPVNVKGLEEKLKEHF